MILAQLILERMIWGTTMHVGRQLRNLPSRCERWQLMTLSVQPEWLHRHVCRPTCHNDKPDEPFREVVLHLIVELPGEGVLQLADEGNQEGDAKDGQPAGRAT